MKPKEYWIELFEKDNFLNIKDWKETIPALIIVGGLQFGTTERAKKKIMEWMDLKWEYGKIGKCRYFEKCWNNLAKNGVFKNGKVYANLDDEKTSAIEFALLISVAQGFLKRCKL